MNRNGNGKQVCHQTTNKRKIQNWYTFNTSVFLNGGVKNEHKLFFFAVLAKNPRPNGFHQKANKKLIAKCLTFNTSEFFKWWCWKRTLAYLLFIIIINPASQRVLLEGQSKKLKNPTFNTSGFFLNRLSKKTKRQSAQKI